MEGKRTTLQLLEGFREVRKYSGFALHSIRRVFKVSIGRILSRNVVQIAGVEVLIRVNDA